MRHQRLRFEWELGYSRIPNMVHLLEAHGVRVFSLPEHLSDVDAFSFWWQGTPFVLLNTRKSAEPGRFDADHEQVIAVKHRWGVAAMTVTHRLHELGLTTDWTDATTCRRLYP